MNDGGAPRGRRRVAFVSTMQEVPWGGSEELWCAAAHRALEDGWAVLASVWRWEPPPPRIAALRAAGARVVTRSDVFPWSGRLQWAWTLARPPLAPVRAFRPDVVCVSLAAAFDVVMRADRYRAFRDGLRGLAYGLVVELNPDFFIGDTIRARMRELFGRARFVAFVSHADRALTERQLGVRLPRAVVVRNPVNLDDASAVEWPDDGVARLASVARLAVWHKGQDALLEALADPRWRTREWSLSFFGEGSDERHLRGLADMYGVADRVRFAGHVGDVRSIWAAHHVLAMPSRVEGAPLAMVEAMLCGRPTVATPVGGIPEWQIDGETGFLAAGASPAAVGAALERAWEERSRWRELGAAARRRAEELIDPDPGRTLLDLIEAALDPRHGAASGRRRRR